MAQQPIAVGSDHAGYKLKTRIKSLLNELGFSVLDLGTEDENSVDYPDYANKVVKAIKSGNAGNGILVCGSGIGMSIAANRHKGIRAALCFDPSDVELARKHNDANILCLGARGNIHYDVIFAWVKTFANTEFEGGRHKRRIEKLEEK